jgi:hypothetical protein
LSVLKKGCSLLKVFIGYGLKTGQGFYPGPYYFTDFGRLLDVADASSSYLLFRYYSLGLLLPACSGSTSFASFFEETIRPSGSFTTIWYFFSYALAF